MKKNIENIDNRIGCIKYIEELEQYDIPPDNFFATDVNEYEYFSDSRICGIFSFGKKYPITFRMITGEENEYGYYRYILRIPTIINPLIYNKVTPEKYYKKVQENFDKARKDGYYFKEGLAGEFICIFAVFLRARFYLRSVVNRNNQEISQKITYPVFLPSTVSEYKEIFNDKKKNLTSDLIPFFEKIVTLPDKGHFNIIHSFREYHEALKNIGIDHDIVYLKLVVAIEGIASIEKVESNFKHDFPECFNLIKDDKEKLNQITTMWANRGSTNSVRSFLKKYLLGIRKDFEKTVYINKEGKNKNITLEKTINRIYASRSKYVHEGRQMTISKISFRDSAYEPTMGGVIDRKKILLDELLPVISYFENIVNISLINYIDINTLVKKLINKK